MNIFNFLVWAVLNFKLDVKNAINAHQIFSKNEERLNKYIKLKKFDRNINFKLLKETEAISKYSKSKILFKSRFTIPKRNLL